MSHLLAVVLAFVVGALAGGVAVYLVLRRNPTIL